MSRLVWRRFTRSRRARLAATSIAMVLLLATLGGSVWAFSIPTEVEQRSTLATYRQSGQFSYEAMLRPGSVFGQMVLARGLDDLGVVRSDQQYFARLVDEMLVTSAYSFGGTKPVDQVEETFTLKLIVAAPDLWQKEVELLPPTRYVGDFSASARVDVAQALALIDEIQQETGVSSTSGEHELRLVAEVQTRAVRGGTVLRETFRQELRGELSRGLLRWVDPLEQSKAGARDDWSYTHRGKFAHTVRLKPSLLFAETKDGARARPLPEGWPIFANVVDSLDVTFDYRLAADRPLENPVSRYRIALVLENPGSWAKEFALVPETEHAGDAFSARFSLDVDRLSDLVEKVSRELGRSATEGVNVVVTAQVTTAAEVGGVPLKETLTHSAKGNLRGTSFSWSKENAPSSVPGQLAETKVVPNDDGYLTIAPLAAIGYAGLSVHGLRILTSVALAIALVGAAYVGWLHSLALPARPSPAWRRDLRTRRKYGDLIARVREVPASGDSQTIVPVSTLEDLVKVAIDGARPILQLGANGLPTYIVIDGATRYVYDSGAHAAEPTAEGASE